MLRGIRNPIFVTYNEMPSRLDLAKQGYGGQFTTREVEDVNNSWRFFLLLTSLIGFQVKDGTTSLSTVSVIGNLFDICENPLAIYSSWVVTGLVIVVCIPVYQLAIRPFFSKYVPRTLTRMKI